MGNGLRKLSRPSTVAAAGLIGGFATGRYAHRRDLAGLVFAAAGGWCVRQWARTAGWPTAAGLGAGYAAAMGLSHPLAKKIGAWPAVAAVTAGTVAASEAAAR